MPTSRHGKTVNDPTISPMTAYSYRAARRDGRIVRGVIESSQAAQVTSVLTARGLFPISVDLQGAGTRRYRPAPRRDLATVFRSIASLADAGVPLEKALVATQSVARGHTKRMLETAVKAIREGEGLAMGLERSEGLASDLIIGMIRAGEKGGGLSKALDQVASHLELEAELVARLKQALAYPILLTVVGCATVFIITTIIVPRFAELLDGVGQNLPPATQLLLATSSFVQGRWLLLIAALASVAVAFNAWLQRPTGRLQWHRFLLSLPILGPIRFGLASARSCSALAAMLHSGMPLLPALEAIQSAAGDRAVATRLAKARELVSQGVGLTQSLEREKAITTTAIQFIAVGEASAQLSAMASRASIQAGQQAERDVRSLVTLLEPALIVIFGALVAFVAAALLQAVYGLRPI